MSGEQVERLRNEPLEPVFLVGQEPDTIIRTALSALHAVTSMVHEMPLGATLHHTRADDMASLLKLIGNAIDLASREMMNK